LIYWTSSCLRSNSILIYFYVGLSDMNFYTSLEFRGITDNWLEVILMLIYIWASYFDAETLEIYYFMCSHDKD